jgi:hypothetical protein
MKTNKGEKHALDNFRYIAGFVAFRIQPSHRRWFNSLASRGGAGGSGHQSDQRPEFGVKEIFEREASLVFVRVTTCVEKAAEHCAN